MISFLAIIFLKEKQSLRQILGVILAVVGLFVTYASNSTQIDISSGIFIGSCLILLSIFGEACFSVLAKKLSIKIKPFEIADIVTVLSTIMLVPFAIYDFIMNKPSNFTVVQVFSVLFYGIFLTYISFILWFKGLEKVKAGEAGIFTALVPISGLFFSAIILFDIPNRFEVIGAILIIISIVLVVYKKS